MKRPEKVLRTLYIVLLVFSCLALVSPFVIPLIFAGSVALAMYPLLLKLESKGVKRKRAAFLLTTIFTFLISIPFMFFTIKGTMAVINSLEKYNQFRNHHVGSVLSTIRGDLIHLIQKYAAKYEFAQFLNEERIDSYISSVYVYVLNFFQSFAQSVPSIVVLLVVMILCIYSFLAHANSVRSFFQALFLFSEERMNQLSWIFIRDARQVYVSNITTGGIQSLIVSTSVALMNLGDFFLVFFVTLILSFIPVIGASPVAFVFAFSAFIKGMHGSAIALTIIGLFTGVIDNILRPYLASLGESKIPPTMSFIAVIGGALLLGFPGLFIGLLVGMIAFDTLPIFWEELQDRHSTFDKQQ